MTLSNRVLAAEDSPTQAASLRDHLEGAGFEVSMARDGTEALAKLYEGSFDIVVSDVVMPGIDGYQLCRAIKDHDPGIPVVLLTSMTDPLDVVNALAAGADNFLRKPYQPAELVHRVRNMLYNKELRQSGRTQIGLELFFLGRRFMINSDREQILDLLVSTFEDLVSVNQQLREREGDLARSNDEIQLRLAETELERERLQAVLAALPQALAVMDADGRIVEANENAADLLGVTSSSLVGELAWDAVHLTDHAGAPIDIGVVEEAARGVSSVTVGTAFDVFVERSDTTRVPVIARSAPVRSRDGSVVGSVGVLQDIAELSAHDPVTGLPGQGILIERLRAISTSSATKATGVLVVTINRYDRTRDALPPGGGDELVAGAVHRLREALQSARVRQRSPSASAAYLGNGELAVIATDVHSERDAIVIGEILAEEIAGPMEVGGVEVDIDVSVGVGMYAPDTDPAELIGVVAASARRLSAAGGRRVATSDPKLHAGVVARLQREAELRRGLAAGQVVAHYQPQIQLRPGHPVSVEALVRWEHPEHGLLGAGEIIPLAIESGLICRLGWVVLEQACRQARQWREELPDGDDLRLSVNVAAQQLAEHDVVEQVERILADTGLEPSALILEITETSVMSASESVSERLRGIKALGVQIAIDDFGTGYSSLLQLRHLPIDILKIDRCFVDGMIDEPADAAIVAGTVSLARALGLELVAEGVETMDQLVQLRVLGCDVGQGFYWSRPLPPEELARWWSRQRHGSSTDEQAINPHLNVMESQDDVIAYLIHELRSPLTAVTGFADLLARDHDVAPTPDLVEGIRRNARELEARLASVSEARQAEQGGITLRPERVDLVDLVGMVVRDLTPQLQPHPVAVGAAPDAPLMASVDRSRLVQALTNLLTNAAKFSPGDTAIEVTIESRDHEAVIRVRDHGPGIPASRRPELFRRFSRLGSRNKGMGVGLYLSRLIAVAHGGSLDHEPARDGGSVFSICIPRDRGEPTTTERGSVRTSTDRDGTSSRGTADQPGRPLTIVHIEDNEAIARLVRQMLVTRPGGVDLHTASDGTTGLALAIEHRPDVVLLDLNLPDLAGEEVLQRLRSDARTESAHVVVISADIGPAQEHLELFDAVDVLKKPFDIDELFRIVAGVRGASLEQNGHVQSGPPLPETQTFHVEGTLDADTVTTLHEIAASCTTPDSFEATVRSFSVDADQRLRQLRSAAEEGNADSLSDAAHALVGLTATFGAHIAADRFRELEQVAHTSDLSAADAAMEAAIEALTDADAALQREFCGPESRLGHHRS